MDGAPAVGERERLSQVLAALAHPARLELLEVLQHPHPLGQIVIETKARWGGGGTARPISRQGIREHLDRLLVAGLVHAVGRQAERGPTYVVNPQALYALAETMRKMSDLWPREEIDAATVAGLPVVPPFHLLASSLVVVKGPREGKTYPLMAPQSGTREWTIGRRRGVDIVLDHDAYVSSENSLITWENGVYSIRDLFESRNGTFVNFTRLEPLDRRALRTGDVVQVGQTTLLFRA